MPQLEMHWRSCSLGRFWQRKQNNEIFTLYQYVELEFGR